MTALPPGWATLGNDEKCAMIELMIADVDADGNKVLVEAEYNRELCRRFEEARQHPEKMIPQAEARAMIEGRLAELRTKREANS